MDIRKFLSDYRIDSLEHGNKHCAPGWIQIHCPLCKGSKNWHMGINLENQYCNCWRCGGTSLQWVIKNLLNISFSRAGELIKQYAGKSQITQKKKTSAPPSSLSLPSECSDLKKQHREYLRNRKFDPKKLSSLWDLKGTNHIGVYKHRIIAPIYHQKKLISFQGRDITGRSELKYKACPNRLEVIPHKESLYGEWLVEKTRVIVVEGIADAWRLGKGAVATFGIEFTNSQLLLLSKYKEIFILFDGEEQAQIQAKELAVKLTSLGRYVELLELDSGDPGEMDQREADYLMKEINLL